MWGLTGGPGGPGSPLLSWVQVQALGMAGQSASTLWWCKEGESERPGGWRRGGEEVEQRWRRGGAEVEKSRSRDGAEVELTRPGSSQHRSLLAHKVLQAMSKIWSWNWRHSRGQRRPRLDLHSADLLHLGGWRPPPEVVLLTGAELSRFPLDRTVLPRTSRPSVLMFAAALMLFSATVLQSITTLALLLLMATCSWKHQGGEGWSGWRWSVSTRAGRSCDLVKAAVEELVDVGPFEGDRLEVALVVVVEEGQSLPSICRRTQSSEPPGCLIPAG